jgi:hypothetical protein
MGHVFSTWLDVTETLGDIRRSGAPFRLFPSLRVRQLSPMVTFTALHLGLTRR